jgi:hypothetical protein
MDQGFWRDRWLDRPGASAFRAVVRASGCGLVAAVVTWGLAGIESGGAVASEADAKQPSAQAEVDFFERQIRPVLVERCYECHSEKAKTLQAGLRLDSAAGLRKGGDSGPALVPGKPDESLLLESLRYESYEMPPDAKLPDSVIEDFARWIELGAADPRTEAPLPQEAREPSTADASQHWAFRPPVFVEPPAVVQSQWPQSDVDRFILARLEQAGLSPSAAADPRTQLRRLFYDLVGLPPSAEEVQAFAAAPDRNAYVAAVDRLLASPEFGERWGRYWLDVARYADTKGYVFQEDRNYPHAHTYRDWVIGAFNRDMPYRDFVLAQLAADQLDDPDLYPAAGFLTLGRRFINNTHDIIDDRIDVVSRGLLGLTATCARCHDHKYDPIATADYYAMYGVFASSREPKDAAAPLLLVDAERPVEPVIFVRGNPANRGPRVPRQFFPCLTRGDVRPYQHGSGRLEMARAIADPENPLTARVWVNRVWLHLFGQGLVTTPSDFGTRCDPPSHPQLLDWLATRFVAEGWSTKWLIRTLVTSQVYRQASGVRPDGREIDPENRLLWRMNRRRLDLEPLRDSMLVAAGRLDRTLGGPSVQLTQEPFPTRRSVYGFIERQNLPNFFRTFDFAGPDTHSPRRPYTTVPQQALYLMNSPFAMEQARYAAARGRAGGEDLEDARIRQLFRSVLGRDPSADEAAAATRFVREGSREDGGHERSSEDPWTYGWGQYDVSRDAVQFQALPHFTGDAWQGGAQLPDPKLGWVMLNAGGGHPGNDAAHAAIRRWVAPRAGRVSISGRLEHLAEQGDGVRGRVVPHGHGSVAEWSVHHGQAATTVSRFTVAAGDAVDLVVDCRDGPSHDGFRWDATVRLEPEDGDPRQWNTTAGFRGPPAEPLNVWERLAQTLMMTNEFAFID